MALSFVRWLHHTCLEDTERKQPFAGMYPLGPQIEATIGLDGDFNLEQISAMLQARYSDEVVEKHLVDLIKAEAAWRVEDLGFDPEIVSTSVSVSPSTCVHVGLDGSVCRHPCVPGTTRCDDHGGSILDPVVRRSVLLIAYAKMLTASDTAVTALIDVLDNSTSALARVYAAREILDRVGLVYEDGAQNGSVNSEAEDRDALMETLKNQMASARERLQLVAVPIDPDDEIADAEIVEP